MLSSSSLAIAPIPTATPLATRCGSGAFICRPRTWGRSKKQLVAEAFATNWIAPLGPHVDAFEQEFARLVGAGHAAALSSGTAAIHLALQLVGVRPDDEVFVSTLTFSASVNPILYLGARPVFIDSEAQSWNMDPEILLGMHSTSVRGNGQLPARGCPRAPVRAERRHRTDPGGLRPLRRGARWKTPPRR